VCLVDAQGFVQVAAFLRTATRQVMWADGLVINKGDLVTPDDLAVLQPILGGINPRAPQIVVSQGQVPESFLMGLTHHPFQAAVSDKPLPELSSGSVQTELPVDRQAFLEVVAGLGGRLLRLKGTVVFKEGARFMEVINGRVLEKDPPGQDTRTAFAVIGWEISREDLTAAFTRCL
jgi:G3E family GTPase